MAVQAQTQTNTGTFSALRSSNFRLYFAGQLISVSGTWMQNLAQGFLVFNMTKSDAWLGAVACAAGVPVLLLSPVAGVIVERMPRRRLLFLTQSLQMLLAVILAALAFANVVQVWHIMILAFLLGAVMALDAPARLTFVIEVVGPEDLSSGIALNSVLNSGGRVLGPMAAGVALLQLGAAWCFLLNGVTFLAVLLSLFLMRVPYAIQRTEGESRLKQLREGLTFSYRHDLIGPLLLLVVVGSFFIIPLIKFLPAVADVVLHSPVKGYAALSAGEGVGAVLAGVSIAWVAVRSGYGRILAISVVLCPIASIIMVLQSNMALATAFGLLSGLFMFYQFVGRNILVQQIVPNQFRGRVLSLYTLAVLGFNPFGALLLGFLAEAIGTANGLIVYMILGGLLGAAILYRWPAIARQR
jgi:MFS family permease